MKGVLVVVLCAAWFFLGLGYGLGRGERLRDALHAQIAVGVQDCRMFFDDVYKRHQQELEQQPTAPNENTAL